MSQKNSIKLVCGKGEKWIINEAQKLTNHLDKLIFFYKNNRMHYNNNSQFKNVVKKLLTNMQKSCDKKIYKESSEERCSIATCESKELIVVNANESEECDNIIKKNLNIIKKGVSHYSFNYTNIFLYYFMFMIFFFLLFSKINRWKLIKN